MAGVTVRIVVKGSPPRTALTDARGEFGSRAWPPGDYTLTATLRGFTPFTTVVSVSAKPSRVAIVLQVAAVSEQRTSAAAAPSVEAAPFGPEMQAGVVPTAWPAPWPMAPPPLSSRPAALVSVDRQFNTETYDRIDDNAFRLVTQDPLSTFSIDVDTASYSNVRRFLNDGTLPPPDAVRIEELINYFRFDYARSARDIAKDAPFSVTTELAPCPWNPRHRLALVGLQARPLDTDRLPRAQSRLPARRLGLDGVARQAPARAHGDADARRHAHGAGPDRDRRLRRRQRRRAAVDQRRAQGARSTRRSRGWKRAARPTAPRGSRSPIRSRRSTSSRAASTA